jgi:hypothetical protein
MPIRRIFAIIWSVGAFLVMLWCWATYSGPFRWAAEWQLEHFGSYEVKLTLFAPLLVLLIPAGFLGGWGPLLPRRPVTRAEQTTNAIRNARIIAALGGVALLIGAAGGALGYYKRQTPPTRANLMLASGTEPAPAADLVTITAIARPDLMTGYQETAGGVTNHWSFVPLVGTAWHPGEPIRFILKTNQTAWMAPGGGMPRMLQPGNPPFRMVTEPSVLKHHELPGLIRAEYEKAHIPLDPSLAVVEQSAGEIYTPYWVTAALGGLMGLSLLLGGLIGAINARKAAHA